MSLIFDVVIVVRPLSTLDIEA